MTARVGKVRIVTKDGKTKLERKRGYVAKNKKLKTDRLVRAWQKRSKTT